MIGIKTDSNTVVHFVTSRLSRGTDYSGSVRLTSKYDNQENIQAAQITSEGFRFRTEIDAGGFVGAKQDRDYDLAIVVDGEDVFIDTAIITTQDIENVTDEPYSYNKDRYTFLGRPGINQYKVLDR